MSMDRLKRNKTRFFAVLLCLFLLAGLFPGTGTKVYAEGKYKLGDAVKFAGHEWYIIGTKTEGVKAPDGCYTLFAKNNDFGSTAFRKTGGDAWNPNAAVYKDSDLHKKMEEIANSFSKEDRGNIVPRNTLNEIKGDIVTDQLLWPIGGKKNENLMVNETEACLIDQNIRKFPESYWGRTSYEAPGATDVFVDSKEEDKPKKTDPYSGSYSAMAYDENGNQIMEANLGVLGSRASTATKVYAVRPALYVKAEALPEKIEGIQVAFGGQWWYVVGQGKIGSVPGPENTVTLFENPRKNLGTQSVLAYTSASSYLNSFLQKEMAAFGSKYLKLAGKESSLIVPRTLTSADGISGQTAHDQPFWPLSKDEADRTDAEILKSELYAKDPALYWLRTKYNSGFAFVYAVQGKGGKVVGDTHNKYNGVRPAFYLDISDAFYLAKDVKSTRIGDAPHSLVVPKGFADFEEYKYTIFDDGLKLYVTADPAQAAQTGETLSFGYVANTGKNQYLSCVLTPDGTTDVLYYNKVVKLSDTAAASGTVNIPLTGVSNGNYTLRLYTEQENNRSTDFASRTVNVQITVKDGTASIRDLGNIQLVGDSGGQGGEDGREVELQNNGTHIQWRYKGEEDNAWRDLVALSAITGASGNDGANGTNGKDGINGKEIELRVQDGYIQWKYKGEEDSTWQNLTALSDLKGESGKDGADGREPELKNDGESILWRYKGEDENAWKVLAAISDLTGKDGKQVEFRVSDGYIQWKYTTDSDWQNLIALSVLQGAKGDKGDKGDAGDSPYIGSNGNWWIGEKDTNIPARGTNGANGLDGENGKDGSNGLTPHIGSNGNWWIGNTDTGTKASGTNGAAGKDGVAGANGKDGINGKDGANGKDGKAGKDGANGKDGIGIADVKLNEKGELIVTLTDKTEKNLGKVKGEDGVSISGVSINEKGELIVSLSNGNTLNAGVVPKVTEKDAHLQRLVYISLGTAGVSLAGLLSMIAFLLLKRKKNINK